MHVYQICYLLYFTLIHVCIKVSTQMYKWAPAYMYAGGKPCDRLASIRVASIRVELLLMANMLQKLGRSIRHTDSNLLSTDVQNLLGKLLCFSNTRNNHLVFASLQTPLL